MRHVAVLFEFPTLNGGEYSMLAVLAALASDRRFRFSAIAPATGDLAAEIQRLDIPLYPFAVRDAGRRQSQNEIQSSLRHIVATARPDILHSNSLAMCRVAGQIDLQDVRRAGHLRDIIKLNQTVISDLNQNDVLIAVSVATRQFHVQQGLDADRCRVIHNGVDVSRFRPRNPSDARSRLFRSSRRRQNFS